MGMVMKSADCGKVEISGLNKDSIEKGKRVIVKQGNKTLFNDIGTFSHTEDPNLIGANIKEGVSILGVPGTLKSGYKPLVFACRDAYAHGNSAGPGGGNPYDGAWYSANFTDLTKGTAIPLSEFGYIKTEGIDGRSPLPVFTITKPGIYYIAMHSGYYRINSSDKFKIESGGKEVRLENGAKFYIYMYYGGSGNGSGGSSIAVFAKTN